MRRTSPMDTSIKRVGHTLEDYLLNMVRRTDSKGPHACYAYERPSLP